MGWNDFSLPAVGTWYDNDDGTSRQEELALCRPGELITLQREPENEHDHMAVAIISERGVKVGYLGREKATWIGSKIDRGYDVRAIVERVKGAHLPGSSLGLVVRVSMDPDRADEPELSRDNFGSLSRNRTRANRQSMVSAMVYTESQDFWGR